MASTPSERRSSLIVSMRLVRRRGTDRFGPMPCRGKSSRPPSEGRPRLRLVSGDRRRSVLVDLAALPLPAGFALLVVVRRVAVLLCFIGFDGERVAMLLLRVLTLLAFLHRAGVLVLVRHCCLLLLDV